jgi:hypothetical protein
MSAPTAEAGDDRRFAWHPDYRDQTVRQVRDTLRVELQRDQRQYGLAMEGAEEHEQQVLATVLELEKRWSGFDLGWAEADAADLADRIVAFEWEREQRRELFPFDEYRTAHDEAVAPPPASARPWWAFWRR